MSTKNLLIAGGTGFIGQALVCELTQQGYAIWVLGRTTDIIQKRFGSSVTAISWDDLMQATHYFDGVINLAGESIAEGRWNKHKKEQLIESRLHATASLVRFCLTAEKPPEFFIQASAVGYYGSQDDRALTENTEPAMSFSHQLCQQWEAAVDRLKISSIRVCITRLGVVLDKKQGAFLQISAPFKSKIALKSGNGKQWFAWISLVDVLASFTWLINRKNSSGIYNVCSFHPLTNSDFTQKMSRHYGCIATFAMPAGLLQLILGEMAKELILASQRVLPARLLSEGFVFKQPEITDFLDDRIVELS